MENNALPKFKCYSEPATWGSRWTRWLTSPELYAEGKGLIIADDATNAMRQRRRALLLHYAGPNIQDIFSTLLDTGEATDYGRAARP